VGFSGSRQTERLRRELLDSGMPIYALAASLGPTGERFGGLELSGTEVAVVHVVYEQATPYGPWVDVETARRVRPEPLRLALEHHVRLGGERCADVAWTESPATLVVDGRSVAAARLRAGERWWALRCAHGGVEITVVGRDWHPAAVAVETMADPAPMLDRLRSAVPAPSPAAEPHRALADAVLRHAAARASWQSGGGPVPELPVQWSRLRQAAVRRQRELSDQPEPVADEAVSAMMSQLAALFQEAAWFRADHDLRRRAVAEVLLHGTALADDVPSRPAQEAWQRRAVRGSAPDGADVRVRVAAEEQWLTGWQAWADGQR